ncbi:four helix bundle protein [Patescibacteria group bacterium]|nr:four helix bundle protein [Patescibacteria group bacterium]
MDLKDLEIYKISRNVSTMAWEIYEKMDWQIRKVLGDQWITSIDSIGANIAEGFGRYHYLDKNRFNYNARGSLLEAIYWTELLKERDKMTAAQFKSFISEFDALCPKLNSYIKSTKNQASK